MINIQLYICGQLVELDKDVNIAITKLFDNLQDPTSIITDWSKTVSIPASINNNKIFGNIFMADRMLSNGGSDGFGVGTKFDPNKMLDMKLFYNGDLLMKGYAKFNAVKRKSSKTVYEIALYSELGKVFKEMLKITFDKTVNEDELKYVIDTSLDDGLVINADTVAYAWTHSRPAFNDNSVPVNYVSADSAPGRDPSDTFTPTFARPTTIQVNKPLYQYDPDRLSSWRNYIGFAPTNAFCDDFDYKAYLSKETANSVDNDDDPIIQNLSDVLTNHWTTIGYSSVDAESTVGDGIKPRAYGEFRSYYQLPYIYFDNFFKMFADKTNELTGYSVNLDLTGTAINDNLKRLCFLGKKLYNSEINTEETCAFNIKTETTGAGGITSLTGKIINTVTCGKTTSKLISDGIVNNKTFTKLLKFTNTDTSLYDITNNYIILDKDYDVLVQNVLQTRLIVTQCQDDSSTYRLNEKCYLTINVTYTGYKNNVETTKFTIKNNVFDVDTIIPDSAKYENPIYIKEGYTIGTSGDIQHTAFDININIGKKLKMALFNDCDGIRVSIVYQLNKYGASGGTVIQDFFNKSSFYTNSYTYIGTTLGGQFPATKVSGAKRSGDYFQFEDLWDNSVKPFDFILNVMKQLGCVWTIDYEKKSVTIMSRKKYFSNYSITDWSNKVDYSNDYSIKPVAFGHKWMVLNYDENNTANGLAYKDKYDVEYGSIKVNTDYVFDTEEEDLFEGLKTSITYTPIILNWDDLYNLKWKYVGTSDVLIYQENEDGSAEEQFGALFIDRGLRLFDENARADTLCVTDDTYFMETTDNYTYLNVDSNTVAESERRFVNETRYVSTYPMLDIVTSNDSSAFTILFNKPMKSYDTTNNYKNLNKSIYSEYWDKYIEERYNNQNKVITCYIKLTVNDYVNFDFNKFVVINHILYMVNKIYDFDPQNLTTKVDLISISDVNGYIS